MVSQQKKVPPDDQKPIQKYKLYIGLVLALGILAGACYLTWLVTDSQWQSKYDSQQTAYADASAKAQQAARDKEQEYATNLKRFRGKLTPELLSLLLMLLLLTPLLTGCTQDSTRYLPTPAPKLPALDSKARAPTKPSFCLPTFSKICRTKSTVGNFADESWNAAATCEASYDAVAK